MRRRRSLTTMGSLVILLLVLIQAAPAAAAAPVSFGAKLNRSSAPSNAENGRRCDVESGIPRRSTCTWVATEAYRRADEFRAPKDGTIGKVKAVTCTRSEFRLTVARYKANGDLAKVRANAGRPVTVVPADPRHVDGDPETYCGGEEGDDYIVRSIRTTLAVRKGDVIAVEAKRLGTLYCAGGGGVELYAPPLVPGAAFRPSDDDTSCLLLIQLVYR